MSTLVTIQSTDLITNSRADINGNFSALNTDKMETSVLDTDTTLAANSDTKIPSQKAVKAYVDAGGNVNASDTTKGIVEEATQAEVSAGTAVGGTGARLFVNPSTIIGSTIFTKCAFGITTRAGNATGSTETIAHGLGITPRFVKITALWSTSDGTTSGKEGSSNSIGVFDGTTNRCVYNGHSSSDGSSSPENQYATSGNSTVYTIYIKEAENSYTQTASVTIDATNISLVWSTGTLPTGTTTNVMWEAYA